MRNSYPLFSFFLFCLLTSCFVKDQNEEIANRDSTSVTEEKEKPAGKFPADLDSLLNSVLKCDTSNADLNFYPVDSSNTRIAELGFIYGVFWLVETEAGCGSHGSCGRSVFVVEEQGEEIKIHDIGCGRVDTILGLSHNGIYDFVFEQRSFTPSHRARYRYKYTGKEFTTENDPNGIDLDRRIVEAIYKDSAETSYSYSVLTHSYIDLGSNQYKFLLADEGGYSMKYLMTQNHNGELKLINTFQYVDHFDVLESKSKGVNDLRIFSGLFEYDIWKWNGAKFVFSGHYEIPIL